MEKLCVRTLPLSLKTYVISYPILCMTRGFLGIPKNSSELNEVSNYLFWMPNRNLIIIRLQNEQVNWHTKTNPLVPSKLLLVDFVLHYSRIIFFLLYLYVYLTYLYLYDACHVYFAIFILLFQIFCNKKNVGRRTTIIIYFNV